MGNKTDLKEKNKVLYNPFKDAVMSCCDLAQYEDKIYPYKNPKNMLEASVISRGDMTRTANMIRKAKAGGDINIGVLGGSITEGSGMSPDNYYGDVLNRWFIVAFPKARIHYYNIGKGTTTSIYGCARVERDVEPLNLDFIVVEYAVNDTILDTTIAKETYEALIRKLLNLPTKPAVFSLLMCMGSFGSTDSIDIPINLYYGIPQASFKEPIKYQASKTIGEQNITEDWVRENYIFDGCHPNTYGYDLATQYITFQLSYVMDHLDEIGDKIPSIPEKPFTNLRFMTSKITDNRQSKILSCDGWITSNRVAPYKEYTYYTDQAGSKLVYKFNCSTLAMVSRKGLSPKLGIVSVQIDYCTPFEVDAYFHNGWGTFNDFKVIIDEYEVKEHTVTFTFTGKKNPHAVEKAHEEGISTDEVGTKFILVEFVES